jgi:hypothetical protein
MLAGEIIRERERDDKKKLPGYSSSSYLMNTSSEYCE